MRQSSWGRWALGGAAFWMSIASSLAADEAAMAECRLHLEAIGKAIKQFEREHGQLPDQLSDLVPKYILDAATLHCPADPSAGSPGRDYAHKDPRLPISYAYEFSADESNGLPTPQGKFPKPDIGNAWGSFRHVSTHQRTFFGHQVPLVRCFHHKPIDSDAESVLNLSSAGKIYTSAVEWEEQQDTVAIALNLMARDLELDPERFREKRDLGRFQEYIYGWEDDERITQLHDLLAKVAQGLERYAEKLTEEKDRKFSQQVAARIWNVAGEYKQALRLVDGTDVAAEAHEGLGEYDQSLAIWKQMRNEKQAKRYYAGRIATAYEKLGQKEQAAEWRLKSDPGSGLVGKMAPSLSVKTPNGGELKLSDFLNGKKAVLLNFWFIGCQPCRMEFPVLQKLYEENHAKGFDILAINYGDAADAITKFIREKDYTMSIGVGGKGDAFPGNAYQVDAYPTNFLVDGTGKILWREAGFDEAKLRAAVERALGGAPPAH
jgi:thiol-disulfide isomerase/thioredoxin